MPFINDPVLRVGDNPDEWILNEPLCYVTRRGHVIIVPRNFVTDLASIPRLLYALFPVNGRHRAAAILHDWLYERQPVDRAQCDHIFLEAMEDSKVRWSQRWAMYLGVRIGGWVAWKAREAALDV